MATYMKTQNLVFLFFLTLMTTSLSIAQKDAEKWTLQASLGVNNPIDNGDSGGYYSKYVNFPTINLGVQYMFSETLGAKLDLGYNRSSAGNSSLPYKLNYTRVNVQGVYNFKDIITFLPAPIAIVGHVGPGVSMTNPLGYFTNNTYTYLNFLGGVEVHYRLSQSFSIFVDGSYVLSLSREDKYDTATHGFSFNDDLMYVALGLSLSLGDGCKCGY